LTECSSCCRFLWSRVFTLFLEKERIFRANVHV